MVVKSGLQNCRKAQSVAFFLYKKWVISPCQRSPTLKFWTTYVILALSQVRLGRPKNLLRSKQRMEFSMLEFLWCSASLLSMSYIPACHNIKFLYSCGRSIWAFVYYLIPLVLCNTSFKSSHIWSTVKFAVFKTVNGYRSQPVEISFMLS